jgi:hypothetical protein
MSARVVDKLEVFGGGLRGVSRCGLVIRRKIPLARRPPARTRSGEPAFGAKRSGSVGAELPAGFDGSGGSEAQRQAAFVSRIRPHVNDLWVSVRPAQDLDDKWQSSGRNPDHNRGSQPTS